MLTFSIAFIAMLSGSEAYVNACSANAETVKMCECQANFLSMTLNDEEILELTVAGANAMSGKNERLTKLIDSNPKIIVALEKLESQSIACRNDELSAPNF